MVKYEIENYEEKRAKYTSENDMNSPEVWIFEIKRVVACDGGAFYLYCQLHVIRLSAKRE